MDARFRKDIDALQNVGRNIKKYRKLKNLSIDKLANLTDTQRKAIWNYEHAKVNCNVTMLYILAKALDIDAYQLLMPYEPVEGINVDDEE